MYKSHAEFSTAAFNGAPSERLNILAICLAGATELGGKLVAVLKPATNVDLVLETLRNETLAGHLPVIPGLLGKCQPRLVLLCLSAKSDTNVEGVFQAIQKCQPELSIIAILETSDAKILHRIIGMGAADFCLAPLRLEDLLPRMVRWYSSISKTIAVNRELENKFGLQHFHGESRAFLDTLEKIPRLAKCNANVFITGETGTGKEMCARAIHQLGPRSDHPFVPVNCGAIPSELVENELFGHEAGAFTGASSTVRGLFHDAEGGSLFLDEIDSLPLQTQVKLLRFLQDQEYRPLGARKACQADIRIIAASNSDMEETVRSGRFRADLLFRLNILPLKLPALRERREDIPPLARHFVEKYARVLSVPIKEISKEALEKLFNYHWPGNVRELENTIERAMVLSDHPIITGDAICLSGIPLQADVRSFKVQKALSIAEFETAFVRRLLALNDGNISKAARAAKKNRRSFWQLMRKHDIVAPAAVDVRNELGQIHAIARTNMS